MKAKAREFKRARSRNKNSTDEKGRVQIRIALLDGGVKGYPSKLKKGNTVRYLVIEDSKVGEILGFLEQALFGSSG